MKDRDETFRWDYSLERNTIYIFGEIDTRMAENVVNQLLYLDDKFKKSGVPREERLITLQINSPGGRVTDGFAIYDTMNYIDATIATVGLGLAASMGAFLLSSGSKGYRRATANTEILLHQPLGGVSGQTSDVLIAAKHMEKTRDRLNLILADNTGKTVARMRKDTDRDNIMTALEALEYGLIDVVLPASNKAAGVDAHAR